MQCPVDQSELPRPGDAPRSFHQCGACAGLWVEEAELRRLAGRGEPQLHAAVRGVRRGGAPVVERAPRRCPACGARLHCFAVEGVELDVCPGCHGLWLDAGELEAVHAWYGRRRAVGRGRRERLDGDAAELGIDLALEAPDLARGGAQALRAGASGAESIGEAVAEFVAYVARDVVFDGVTGLLDGL